MRQSASDTKKRVMIICPDTGKPVFTGFEFTKRLEDATYISSAVDCPHCARSHVWSNDVAFLEVEDVRTPSIVNAL